MSLDYLYYAISWLLLRWHDAWGALFGFHSDLSWVLSIIFLVITIRLILFPLFVKQIKSQRKMQEIQPKMRELQAKHKGDKETLQREMMALYRENGANPVAGCLPIFLQAPVFLSLYHVLKRLDPTSRRIETLYGWTSEEFRSAAKAKIFGAPISAHLTSSSETLDKLDASGVAVKIVGVVLIAIMVITTYITQRQMIAKQLAAGTPMDPQQLMIQRLMLYGIPASLLISGALFPLGVVLYWCTTNVWSMGQQFYVLRKMPLVGVPAVDARQAGTEPKVAPPKPGARPQKAKRATTKAAGSDAAAAANKAAKSGTGGASNSGTASKAPSKAAAKAPAKKATKAVQLKKPPAGDPSAATKPAPSAPQSPNGATAEPDSPSTVAPTSAAGTSGNGAAAKPGGRAPTNKARNRKGGRR